ncbi:IclR family transcriptional regulator [Arthrobacter castelli]|uniref:IclR family transcriptional regulator n=1 Tax=Arthrobacter castelli TaxID=271431 RepID=UPI00041D4AC4|nr:helix-turn-helix domain-containing protein [Arthrobacter castelli]
MDHESAQGQSVVRSLSILRALATVPDASVEEIVDRTGIPLSSVYRLLGPLVDSGFLHKSTVGRYGAGPTSVKLAARYRDETLEKGAITSRLTQLSNSSGELVAFVVPQETEALCVQAVESRNTLRCCFSVGASQPLVRGATAISILSRLCEESRSAVFKTYRLDDSDILRIRESCDRAARDGFAISLGELDQGVWGVSSPVTDADDRIRGTVTLMAPANRIHHRQQQLVRQVREAALNLSGGHL